MNKVYTIFISMLLMLLVNAHDPVTGGISGSGGGSKQTWGEIINNPNLKPTFPIHSIQGYRIRFNHLCYLGERVRTKYKQIVGNSTEQRSKILFDYLEVDRVREETICVERRHNNCLQWRTVEVRIPFEANIKVYKRSEQTGKWSLAFDKVFELPRCEPRTSHR